MSAGISSGQGASANVSIGGGRTFPMQPSWSHDTNRCDLTRPINVVTVTNPGSRIATVGKATSLQIVASGSTGRSVADLAGHRPARRVGDQCQHRDDLGYPDHRRRSAR